MDLAVDLGPASVYYYLEPQRIRVWLLLLGALCLLVAWTACLMVWSVWLCINRRRKGDSNNLPPEENNKFPSEVLTTRFGEKYHLTKQCSSLRSTTNLQTRPLCSICAEYVKEKNS